MSEQPILKVALPDKSVESTDMRDFAFHSDYSSIKIFAKPSSYETVTVSGSSSTTVSITHDIGFFPLGMLWIELTPGSGRWFANPFFNISSEDTYVTGDFSYTGLNASTAAFKIINKTSSSKTVKFSYDLIGDSGK
jgi:hypothetical protein